MTRCSGCNTPVRNHVWPINGHVFCSLGCWRYTSGDIFIDKHVKEEKGGIWGAMQYNEKRLGERAAGDSGPRAKRRKG